MKKHFAAFVAGLTAFLSLSVMPVDALSLPIKGDFNQDWQVNISDLICLQNYLLGRTKLSPQFGIYPYDINDDKAIDIFDYIELKKQIISPELKIETDLTRCADSVSEGFFIVQETEKIITSAKELEDYFLPMNILTITGECIITETASEKITEEFMAKYDDAFFKKNILLLKYLDGVNQYTIKSTYYNADGDFVIEYTEESDPLSTEDNPLPPIIAQVTMPKDVYSYENNVIWKKVEQSFDAQVKSEYIQAITVDGVKYASDIKNQPKMINSPEELDKVISGKFRTGIEMSLKNTYNDAFFENNSLILDMNYKAARDFCNTSVTVEKDSNDEITLKYSRNFYDGLSSMSDVGIELHQIVIPKNYSNATVKSEKSWLTPVKADSYNMYYFSELKMQDSSGLKIDNTPQWVNSKEEFQSYIIEHFTEENIDIIDADAFDWENNAVCVWIDVSIMGDSYTLNNVIFDNQNEQLIFSRNTFSSCGDIADANIHLLEVEKAYSGYTPYNRNIYINETMPACEGERLFLETSNGMFMINQYQFHETNVADIYQLYHVGFVRYGTYKYLGTIEFEKDYFPIKSIELSDYENENAVFESGECIFTVTEDDITIRYKYSADSEYMEKTFTKQPMY